MGLLSLSTERGGGYHINNPPRRAPKEGGDMAFEAFRNGGIKGFRFTRRTLVHGTGEDAVFFLRC